MCCIDISKAGDGWNTSNANWQKKCCMPSNGYGVIPPPSDVPDEKIPAINIQNGYLPVIYLLELLHLIYLPNNCSSQVPATAKSGGSVIHPITSILEI